MSYGPSNFVYDAPVIDYNRKYDLTIGQLLLGHCTPKISVRFCLCVLILPSQFLNFSNGQTSAANQCKFNWTFESQMKINFNDRYRLSRITDAAHKEKKKKLHRWNEIQITSRQSNAKQKRKSMAIFWLLVKIYISHNTVIIRAIF